MLGARIALVSLLVTTTYGCGSHSQGAADAPPTTSPPSSTTPTTPSPGDASQSGGYDAALATRELRTSLQAARAQAVIWFQSDTSVAGHSLLVTRGAATRTGWTATTTANDPSQGKPYVMAARSTHGTVWMQMHGWSGDTRGCWLQMSSVQVPVGILAMTPDQPAYVTVLRSLHTTGFTDTSQTSMVGALGLNPALHLLPGRIVQEIHLTAAQVVGTSVPVRIDFAGPLVHRVILSGDVLVQAITRSGGSITSPDDQVLAHLRVTITYPHRSALVRVTAPAPALVMRPGQHVGCHAS